MKRLLIVAALSVTLLLASCSSEEKSVDITLGEGILGDRSVEEVLADDEVDVKDLKDNGDGTVTLTVTKDQQAQMLKETKEQIETIDLEDYDTVESIEPNKDLSKITVIVNDQEAFEQSMDAFITLPLGFSGSLYQAVDGKTGNDVNTVIEFKEDGKKPFHTFTFPEDLPESEE